MNLPQEPPNGDFVAYIEQLQRESAARLSRPSAPVPIDTGARATASAASKSATEHFATHAAPAMSKAQVEELVTRLATSRPAVRAIGGAIALALGAFGFLIWLVSDRSGFWLVAAVALVIWGYSRLRASLAELSSSDRRVGRDVVLRWFGPTRRP